MNFATKSCYVDKNVKKAKKSVKRCKRSIQAHLKIMDFRVKCQIILFGSL